MYESTKIFRFQAAAFLCLVLVLVGCGKKTSTQKSSSRTEIVEYSESTSTVSKHFEPRESAWESSIDQDLGGKTASGTENDKLVYDALSELQTVRLTPEGTLGGNVYQRAIEGLRCRLTVILGSVVVNDYHCSLSRRAKTDSVMAQNIWNVLVKNPPIFKEVLTSVRSGDKMVSARMKSFVIGDLFCSETTDANSKVTYSCEVVGK